MTKFIRKIIGAGAIVILAGLSILISLTVKALGWLGVDISDVFTCEVKVNGSHAEEIAQLKQTIEVLNNQIDAIADINKVLDDTEDHREDIDRYTDIVNDLDLFLHGIGRAK